MIVDDIGQMIRGVAIALDQNRVVYRLVAKVDLSIDQIVVLC